MTPSLGYIQYQQQLWPACWSFVHEHIQ